MRNYLRPIMIFTKANLLRFFRDKVYLFFMFILPVMFLFIFGMVYGNNFSTFKIAIFDEASTALSGQFVEMMTNMGDGVMEKVEVVDWIDAEDRLIRGELSAIVEFPEGFGEVGKENAMPAGEVKVVYGKNSEQAGQTISWIVNSMATETNYAMMGQRPSVTVKSESLAREGLTNFDYVFAGLLGYTVLSIGLMGIANLLPGDKESGATKRLRATTIKPSQIVLSYALTFLVVGIISFLIMIVLGLLVFNFHMRGNWFSFAAFTAISTMMMLGFGLFVGGWARNEAQASALANLIMFPMMFLSGVFFPMFMMPGFIQVISRFIPLTPVVDGIRLIITENYSLIQVLPQLGVVVGWGVIIYFIAIKSFRWE